VAKPRKKLVLIDANAFIHRAYHVTSHMFGGRGPQTKKGRKTGVPYGFALMLLALIKNLKPDFAIAAFDTGKKTFRNKIFKQYKATRTKAPQELYDQIPLVFEILKAFNLPALTYSNYEADDIIGALATQAPKNLDVYIVTGDKDALQLVDKNIFVYTPQKGLTEPKIYTPKDVKKEMGIKPKQIIDFKALAGDSSDNIPGVPGIGPKRAVALLKEFGNLQKIYQNLDKIPSPLAALLKKYEKKARLSQKLATLVTDLPLKLDLPQASLNRLEPGKIKRAFQKLEFKSLIKRIPDAQKELPF